MIRFEPGSDRPEAGPGSRRWTERAAWLALACVTIMALLLPVGAVQAAVPFSHSGVPALSANWTKLNLTNFPSNRSGLALAYDAKDGYVVEFGGAADRGRLLTGTWIYSAGRWSEIFPKVKPPGQSPTMMAYDGATQKVILLAYNSTAGPAKWQTWGFSGGRWADLRPAHSPSGFGWLTYDASTRSILFYGAIVGSNRTVVWETWSYNGTDWSQDLGAGSPLAGAVGMAYDPAYAGVVMVGYPSSSNRPGNVTTCLFRNGTWSTLSVASEPAAVWASGRQQVVYDTSGGFLLLSWSKTSMGGPLRAEQTYGFSSGHWVRLTSQELPRARANPGMTYDAADGYVIQFGGRSTGGLDFNQTWVT